MSKKHRTVRIYQEDLDVLEDITRQIAATQKARVSPPEVLRRTFNIPNLKEVLLKDAVEKRYKK